MYFGLKSLRAYLGMLITLIPLILANKPVYPELRSDLQDYQDTSRCYPDVGEWYLIYRNYYEDADFGGTAKCVKYSRYGSYENFSTPAVFTFGEDGYLTGKLTLSSTDCYVAKNKKTFVPDNNHGPDESLHVIYIECATCFVARHPYAGDGQGCSFWRRSDSLHESAHCCEFIYDQNCGAFPKYEMYNPTCKWVTPTIKPVAVEETFAFSLKLA